MVLGRRADHRRAADVDVLDHLVLVDAGASGGALERIEVDADEVNELDVLLGRGAEMVGVVADREQTGVELRVERLDAAVHDLRRAGEVVDRANLETGVGQLARGASGRDDLDAERHEATGEVDDAALVGDRQKRAAHPYVARPDRLASVASAGCRVGLGRDDSMIAARQAASRSRPIASFGNRPPVERSTPRSISPSTRESASALVRCANAP